MMGLLLEWRILSSKNTKKMDNIEESSRDKKRKLKTNKKKNKKQIILGL